MRCLAVVGLSFATGCASLAGLDDYGEAAVLVGGGAGEGGDGHGGAGGEPSTGGATTGGAGGMGGTQSQGGGGSGGGAPPTSYCVGISDTFDSDFGAIWQMPAWNKNTTDYDAVVIDGEAQFSWTDGQVGLHSNLFFLQECSIQIQLVQAPPSGQFQAFFYFQTIDDTVNRAGFKLLNGELQFRYVVGGGDMGMSIPYMHSDMSWWRLSKVGGTLFWATSSNGQAWTTRFEAPDAVVTSAERVINLGGGMEGIAQGTSEVVFDNLNPP